MNSPPKFSNATSNDIAKIQDADPLRIKIHLLETGLPATAFQKAETDCLKKETSMIDNLAHC